eukprot:5908567-Amphidinium_carterae.1
MSSQRWLPNELAAFARLPSSTGVAPLLGRDSVLRDISATCDLPFFRLLKFTVAEGAGSPWPKVFLGSQLVREQLINQGVQIIRRGRLVKKVPSVLATLLFHISPLPT